MTDLDQQFQDQARDEIFDLFIKKNPDSDPSVHDLIRQVIRQTLDVAEEEFKGVLRDTTSLALKLPPDVAYCVGAYTSFTYTIADSPEHGRVVLLGGSRGQGVTDPVFLEHFNTMKHVVNSNPPEPPTKH